MNKNFRMREKEAEAVGVDKGILTVSVGVPVWGIVCFLASILYVGGQWNQKMNTLIEGFAKMEVQNSLMQEKQNVSNNLITALQTLTTAHEARLTALELAGRRK